MVHRPGEASDPAGFVHSALIYGSDEEFMGFMLPFVEEGIARSEPTLVAVQGRHAENLRSALGGEPRGVRLHWVEEWDETSARTRDKFARWARERTGARRVRLVGESSWPVGNEARVRDWARHESVINVAFEGLPVTFVCPYDERALPPRIVQHARSTHPEIAAEGGWRVSEDYEDPAAFCERLDRDVERPRTKPVVELGFALADLPTLRGLVRSMAVRAGLGTSRTDEFALAANEIATNAVVHGRLPASLRIWLDQADLVCEVTDAGAGIENPLVGQLTPPATALGGRGLWLARMICDAVEIRNGAGCSVTLRVELSRAPVPV